jgi:mannose-6-phosphate isomerase
MTTKLTNQYSLQPFKLKPTFAERVWGRESLTPWFTETGMTGKVGEAWLTGKDCVIDGGDEHGRTLGDLAAQCTGTLGDGEFPLLVKLLFPDDKLSVQVHPDDHQAQQLGFLNGKTECWYVLDARPGAEVACGVHDGTTLDEIRAAITAGTLESLLKMIPVKTGDMIFVDAGTIHAIGPGVTLLEVQQVSDTTYRLFDYGRDRELHLEEGLAVVKPKTKAGLAESIALNEFTRLIKDKYFIVDRFELAAGTVVEMAMEGAGCVVGIAGGCAIDAVRFGQGETVVIPPGSFTASSAAGGTFIRAMVPEVEKGFMSLFKTPE